MNLQSWLTKTTGMTIFDRELSVRIGEFLSTERVNGPLTRPIALTAVGTMATVRLADASFAALLEKSGADVLTLDSVSDLKELISGSAWNLALVLSPFKSRAQDQCSSVSPRALRVGAVDTIVRYGDRLIGYNVNSVGVEVCLSALAGPRAPERVLVLGSGVIAACAVVGAARVFHAAEVGVLARSPERALALTRRTGIGHIVADAYEFGASMVIHATTVGERDDSAGLELAGAFKPGIRLLDANTRFSQLQRSAVEAGAIVLGGTYLQYLSNLLRVAIVSL